MADTVIARRGTSAETEMLELPVLGYPISEDAICAWFLQRYGRQPADQEVGAIMAAMAEREAAPPRTGPDVLPEGWTSGVSVSPAARH